MDEKLKSAYGLFYEHDYKSAEKIFSLNGLSYEAGLCALLSTDLDSSRKYFNMKKEICPASSFGLLILDIIENKPKKQPKFFQIRSFLEIFINLFIENKFFVWAQKIIDEYRFFASINPEVPKFIARVLNANNQNKAVHFFAGVAKEVCFYDAEIHFIDASLYIKENNLKDAKKVIEECMSFAGEYYPILKLKQEIEDRNILN